MVSGDNLETAKQVAIRAGIISDTEARENKNVCMTGEEFRNRVGVMRKEVDSEGNAKLCI